MEKRRLGNTGIELSLLGFGGFHLCEIQGVKADQLLNEYLNRGGNYVETAPSYGDGESEIKIGKAISHRRQEFYLATKAHHRDYKNCKETFAQSLKNLQTDYVDLLLMHAVGTMEELHQILGEDGAMKAALEEKAAGRVKHIGISMHGQPDVLIEALQLFDFEAVMTTINYFDVCNFPKIKKELLPLAKEKGAGIILMKPLGDGYLYKSIKDAFNYAFNQEVSVVVTGMNTMDMLEEDFKLALDYPTLTENEEERIMHEAVELGDYVCRQCNECLPCPMQIPIPEIFRLEGVYDRQMNRGEVSNAAEYALQERLKHWFGTEDKAKLEYRFLTVNGSSCTECGECMPRCPYNINIIEKLKTVEYKLKPEYGKIWE